MEEQWRYNFVWIGEGDDPFQRVQRAVDPEADQQYSAALISGELDPAAALDRIRQVCGEDVPWLVLSKPSEARTWLELGAAGFLPPNTDSETILATLSGISRLLELAGTRNPLTGLPGNRTITYKLRTDVLNGSSLAAYLDISGFKPFNDYYGFTRGDAVIRALADILAQNIQGFFTGHVGGDDFVCIGEGEDFATSVSRAVRIFNGRAGGFYSGRDHAEGGIEALDRSGEFRFYPIMDLTMSFVDGTGCSTVEELACKAGLEKKRIKGEMLPGTASALFRDDGSEPCYTDYLEWMESCHPDRIQVKAVLESAGILGDRRMTSCLVDILGKEADHHIRKSAARALGHVAGAESARALQEALKDRSAHVRTAAATALPMVMGREAGGILQSCLGDSSTWVRRAALRGLGISGWQDAADILRHHLRKPAKGRFWLNYRQELAAAIDGIAFLGNQNLIEEVISVLENNPGIGKDVIWRGLIALGGERCAAQMIRCARSNGYGDYIHLLNRLDLTDIPESVLHNLQMELIGITYRNSSDRISVLKFLQRVPGQAPEKLADWLFTLLDRAEDPDEFQALFNTLAARKVPPRGFDLGRIINRTMQNRLGLTRKGMVSMLRWASTGKYTLSKTFLEKLLRHDSREIRNAAARTVVQLVSRKKKS